MADSSSRRRLWSFSPSRVASIVVPSGSKVSVLAMSTGAISALPSAPTASATGSATAGWASWANTRWASASDTWGATAVIGRSRVPASGWKYASATTSAAAGTSSSVPGMPGV